MSNQPKRICRHTYDDGTECHAHPLQGKQYCFFHDPAMKKKRATAGRDGGLMRGQQALAGLKLPSGMFTAPLQTSHDLADLLRETIMRFCRGEIDARLAMVVGYMANILLRALNHPARQNESPAFADAAFTENDEAWSGFPDTEEGTIELLQREMAEAKRLMTEMEAGS